MQQPQHIIKNKSQNNHLLLFLFVLTGFFMILEVSLFIQNSGLYLGDFKMIANHLSIPKSIIPGVIFFICMQLLIHLAYVYLIWSLTCLCGLVFKSIQWHREKSGIGFWMLGMITILLANQLYFPNSKFAMLTSAILPLTIVKYALLICMLAIVCVSCIAIYGLFLILSQRVKLALGILSIGLAATVGFSTSHGESNLPIPSTTERPNIILIGVDSLRPDFLGFFGAPQQSPHIDAFLNNAAVFAESMTPLARTFPSWVSILTSEYPKNDNVRFNLQSDINYNLSQTLPAILHQHGYETVFATDETRFSNIDTHFGFDRLVTPPIGFNDFLVGTLNDFPMSNLLVNSTLGQYVFPYSYGNRPVFTTYDPNSFLNLLRPTLSAERDKPLFLAVHFCLPHYPYYWKDHYSRMVSVADYRAAVTRADQQVNDLLVMLKKNHLLEHSVVVLLSDHGEALELSGDRITAADLFMSGKVDKNQKIPQFYPHMIDSEAVDRSAGHGTDVLGLPQYHTVLAFRYYGIPKQANVVISGRVSLLDIKPTVLRLLNLTAPDMRGHSLLPYISGSQQTVAQSDDFFTESDFSPSAVRTVHPEARSVLFEGIDFFQINPVTARLSVKKSMADMIISSKQFADFYGPWVLALYPQNKVTMTPILVNLETGYWTNDLTTAFAKQAPTAHMLNAMHHFFGSDITHIENT